MSRPRVSVLLPVYNAARYLAEALESIAQQTLKDFECIIVDDGSTDNSEAVAKSFAAKDARFSVTSRPNTGIVGALNDGLELCRAKYIARMDADDIAMPERLARQVEYLDSHPECVALGTWVELIDPDHDPLWIYRPPVSHDTIFENLKNGNSGALVHPTLMLRTENLRALHGYRAEWQHIEDLDLYWRLTQLGKLANLEQVLLKYRQHTSSANVKRAQEQICLTRKRLELESIEWDQSDQPRSKADLRAQWATWALNSGHYSVYRKHARALRRIPGNEAIKKKLRRRFFKHMKQKFLNPGR